MLYMQVPGWSHPVLISSGSLSLLAPRPEGHGSSLWAPWSTAHADAELCMGLLFYQRAQTLKRCFPLGGDLVQVAARLFHARLIHAPNGFASRPQTLHEARRLHRPQVFGDRLARDLGIRGEPGDGERSVTAQVSDQPQARLVSQRREHVSGSGNRAWAQSSCAVTA